MRRGPPFAGRAHTLLGGRSDWLRQCREFGRHDHPFEAVFMGVAETVVSPS